MAPSGREPWQEKVKAWFRVKRNRRIVIVAAVVLAAVLAVVAAVSSFVQPPDIPERPLDSGTPTETVPLEEGDQPARLSGHKKDYYTFLIVGRDTGGGGNTDTMMLASYDVAKQEANVMSIPRDTMTNVRWSIKRLNSVYNVYGIDGLREHVEMITGVYPDFYVIVEWTAVGELVDAIGGVMFDVPYNMNYDDDAQNLHIHQEAGLRRLYGDDAMQVIRWRKNNGNQNSVGDIGRLEIQQDFMAAVVKECLQLKNLPKVGELAEIFQQNVETNLSIGNLIWFGTQAFQLDTENDLHFYTLPANYNASWKGQSYVIPYGDELLELVNESFNPYLKDLKLSDLSLMQINSNGTLSVTTGTLADSSAGYVPSTPKPTPTPTPVPTPTAVPTPTPAATPPVSPPNETGPETSETPQESETPVPEPTPTDIPLPSDGPPAPPATSPPPLVVDPTPSPAVSPVPTPAETPNEPAA